MHPTVTHSATNFHALAQRAAHQAHVPVGLFLSLVEHESGWNPSARSPAGAFGLTQLMPGTARGLGVDVGTPWGQLLGGAKYLRMQFDRFHSWRLALAAYNAGPGAVERYGGVPPFAETRAYVTNVLGGQGKYGGKTFTAMGEGPIPQVEGPVRGLQGVKTVSVQKPGIDPGAMALWGLQHGDDPEAELRMASEGNFAYPVQHVRVSVPGQLREAPSAATGATLRASGLAGGFLARGAAFKQGRADQGRDFQTNAGGAIIAPGAGYVVRVGSDPHGFGPNYPIVHFTSGPYAGRTMYIGHTHSTMRAGQRFGAGAVLSRTGTRPVGNASVPGWAEIGYAPGGNPGAFGQNTPF